MKFIKRDQNTKEPKDTVSFRTTESRIVFLKDLAIKLNTDVTDVINQLIDLAIKDSETP